MSESIFRPKGIAPTAEQLAIQLERHKHVIVEANAGAAKTTTLALLPFRRKEIAGGAKAVNRGTWTAPSRQIPIRVIRYSRLLPISVATRLPEVTPSALRTAANRSDSSRSSP